MENAKFDFFCEVIKLYQTLKQGQYEFEKFTWVSYVNSDIVRFPFKIVYATS